MKNSRTQVSALIVPGPAGHGFAVVRLGGPMHWPAIGSVRHATSLPVTRAP